MKHHKYTIGEGRGFEKSPLLYKGYMFMATFKSRLSFLRDLLALKEVIDAGRIQGAARRNGIKQSNLSKIITDLESSMNTTLLQRSPKGVEPTNTARLLYTDIDNILKSLDRISKIFETAEDLAGCVTVYVSEGFLGNGLLKELSLFYASHLKIRLDLVTGAKVNSPDIDFAIVSDLSFPMKGRMVFKTESKMSLYASKSYLNRHGMPQDMTDLMQNFDICVQQRHLDDPSCRLILKKAKHLNTTSDSEAVIFSLVRAGDGIALLHDWDASRISELTRLDLDFGLTRPFYGVCNTVSEKTPKIQALIHHLKSMSEEGRLNQIELCI